MRGIEKTILGVRRLAAALSNVPEKDLVEPGSRACRPPTENDLL